MSLPDLARHASADGVFGKDSYTWQFNGYALAADIGYRALSTNVNFSNGVKMSNLDLVIHGPLIGMTVKF
jgi:hypothetical protein